MTIRSFRCADTGAIHAGRRPQRFRNVESAAQRKRQMLDDAVELRDLLAPPGNRLEASSGDRAGQHSIRINGQWRVRFKWTVSVPENAEIVDYH